jgi:hypothetical protein
MEREPARRRLAASSGGWPDASPFAVLSLLDLGVSSTRSTTRVSTPWTRPACFCKRELNKPLFQPRMTPRVVPSGAVAWPAVEATDAREGELPLTTECPRAAERHRAPPVVEEARLRPSSIRVAVLGQDWMRDHKVSRTYLMRRVTRPYTVGHRVTRASREAAVRERATRIFSMNQTLSLRRWATPSGAGPRRSSSASPSARDSLDSVQRRAVRCCSVPTPRNDRRQVEAVRVTTGPGRTLPLDRMGRDERDPPG